MITIKVPATSANLGPGFDCLGLAVSMYNTVEVEPSKTLKIEIFWGRIRLYSQKWFQPHL